MNPYHDNVKKDYLYEGMKLLLNGLQVTGATQYRKYMITLQGYEKAIKQFAEKGSFLLSGDEQLRIRAGEMPDWAIEVFKAVEQTAFGKVVYE